MTAHAETLDDTVAYYHGATICNNSVVVHVPKDALGKVSDKGILLLQLVYGSTTRVGRRQKHGRLASETRWKSLLHTKSLWAVYREVSTWVRSYDVPALVRGFPRLRIRMEPTMVVEAWTCTDPILVSMFMSWEKQRRDFLQSKHCDATFWCDYSGSNVALSKMMHAREVSWEAGAVMDPSVPGTQNYGRLTTIYCTMEKTERRKLIDLESTESIVQVDIRSTNPAMYAAHLAKKLRTRWVTNFQRCVAESDVYMMSVVELSKTTWVFPWGSQQKVTGLRDWAKRVWSAWFTRPYRGATKNLPKTGVEPMVTEYQDWAARNRCPWPHERMHEALITVIETLFPELAVYVSQAYQGSDLAERPYAVTMGMEVQVMDKAYSYYKSLTNEINESPIWSTVYDCVLTRRGHQDLAVKALSWALNEHGVATGITVGHIVNLTASEVQAYGVAKTAGTQAPGTRVDQSISEWASRNTSIVECLATALVQQGYQHTDLVGSREHIPKLTEPYDSSLVGSREHIPKLITAQVGSREHIPKTKTPHHHTHTIMYAPDSLPKWLESLVKVLSKTGGYRLQIKGRLDVSDRDLGSLVRKAIRKTGCVPGTTPA